MVRAAAREVAVQLGFAAVSTGEDPREIVERFLEPEHYAALAGESGVFDEKPSRKDCDFILKSVAGVAEHREELDGLIGKYARGWRTERISRSAAAVMRQAMFEILYMDDVPCAASIDEAVELAKGYEDAEVVSFINGVLGGFYRGEVKKPEPTPEQTDE